MLSVNRLCYVGQVIMLSMVRPERALPAVSRLCPPVVRTIRKRHNGIARIGDSCK